MQHSKKKYIVSMVICFIVGAVLATFITHIPGNYKKVEGATAPNVGSLRQIDTKYKFIQPLLGTELGDDDQGVKWYPVEQQMRDDLNTEIKKDSDVQVGLYFLNLQNSSWVGINSS